jgi:biopolymer transport protein ExbD
MSFGGSSGGGVRSDINITPLVDVVLVLLIIFMVAVPVALNEMKLTVPDKEEVASESSPALDQVVVSVTKEGSIKINSEDVHLTDLQGRMKSIMDVRSEHAKLVFFDIDDDANYGHVMSVMDACKGGGAKILGIMTK